jgi:hypothetical protein
MRYWPSISLTLVVHVVLSIVVLMAFACTNKQDSGEGRGIDATVAAGVEATVAAEGDIGGNLVCPAISRSVGKLGSFTPSVLHSGWHDSPGEPTHGIPSGTVSRFL